MLLFINISLTKTLAILVVMKSSYINKMFGCCFFLALSFYSFVILHLKWWPPPKKKNFFSENKHTHIRLAAVCSASVSAHFGWLHRLSQRDGVRLVLFIHILTVIVLWLVMLLMTKRKQHESSQKCYRWSIEVRFILTKRKHAMYQ